jgi:membrane fusion protein (multidrug efflux system)
MSLRKKLLFLPAGGLLLAAVAVFLLGRFQVISIPGLPGAKTAAAADESGEDAKESKKSDKKKGEEEEEVIAVPVELARAEPRQISAYHRASSFVEADRQVELVSKAQGRVQKLNVEEGNWVAKGDILAELENGKERIRLRQAELKLDDQTRELKRRETLLEQNLITREEFDATRSAWELADTEKALAEIALEETLIRSPFDGQVTERRIVPGQHINLSEPVFTLVDFEPLRVRIHLPEVVARKVRAGDRVEVVLEALEAPVPAVVEMVAPVVDPTTSTVKLTLLLEGEAKGVRVGSFVKVRITTDTHLEALAIPKIALVEEGGLRSVFIAEADTVRKVEVKTGLNDDRYFEVLEGIEPGACVPSDREGCARAPASKC